MYWQIKNYEILDSTNLEAQRLIKQSCAEHSLDGLVVKAKQQTGGKGRLGRAWESSMDAGLWFSAVLELNLPIAQASLYSFAAAVAVAEAIKQETALPVQLKWPNDVLLYGKKLCGILLELAPCSKSEYYMIIGIGVNVNQQKEDFPEELQEKAISLAMAQACSCDQQTLLSLILEKLRENSMLLADSGFKPLRTKWIALSSMIGREVSVQQYGKETYNGVAEDLSMDGMLLIRTNDGLISVSAGDVSLRANDGGYSI